jgi:sec-independent protein translocase protein TatA
MVTPTLAMLNGWEIVLILAVVLVLFGARKLPELARGLGQGIKEFKKATRDVQDEIQGAMDAEPPPQQRRLPDPPASASSTSQQSSAASSPEPHS